MQNICSIRYKNTFQRYFPENCHFFTFQNTEPKQNELVHDLSDLSRLYFFTESASNQRYMQSKTHVFKCSSFFSCLQQQNIVRNTRIIRNGRTTSEPRYVRTTSESRTLTCILNKDFLAVLAASTEDLFFVTACHKFSENQLLTQLTHSTYFFVDHG